MTKTKNGVDAETTKETNGVDEGMGRVVDVARYLALSRAKIYLMMDAGELAYVRFGKSRRIPWAAVHDLVSRSTVPVR